MPTQAHIQVGQIIAMKSNNAAPTNLKPIGLSTKVPWEAPSLLPRGVLQGRGLFSFPRRGGDGALPEARPASVRGCGPISPLWSG